MTISVRAIKKSISPGGHKIATIYARYPLFIHNELLTHRAFSRNSASSRAIPFQRMLKSTLDDPVVPIHWGKNEPGMQARDEIPIEDQPRAVEVWYHAMGAAVQHALELEALGIHKQIVNRLLAPYAPIETLITATEWVGFFRLRCHPDAEPHMQALADGIRDTVETEGYEPLPDHGWHIPFLDRRDVDLPLGDQLKVSVARCAMVSYHDPDGKPTPREKEFERYDRLLNANPMHASPFEHQARSSDSNVQAHRWRNFRFYTPYRAVIETEQAV